MSGRRAARLPRHRGPAGWSAILPGQAPAVPLPGDARADVAVVGAGFAGLSAARRLRQLDPSLEVVVLDAGRLAEGASGRNSGFMIDLPHALNSHDYAGAGDERALIGLNRYAIDFALENVARYGIDPAFADRAGKVNGAGGDKATEANRRYAQHLDALGEPHEWLDEQAMHELTGSRYYRSGLYTPGTLMLQPAGYIRGLGEGLRREARVYEQSPVQSMAREGGAWRLQTPQGAVSAGAVILANNGQIESFGLFERRLMHIFLYATVSPELDPAHLGGAPRWGVTPADPMGTTVRRIDSALGGERIITRACASFRPGMEASEADLARARRVMQGKFDARFPQLAGTAPQYSWAGHLCLSLNDVSVVQQLDDGLYAACCQNGLGAARGTLTGIGAAELALGQRSPCTDYFNAAEAPRRLPPLASLGANAVLRWREWRAGSE